MYYDPPVTLMHKTSPDQLRIYKRLQHKIANLSHIFCTTSLDNFLLQSSQQKDPSHLSLETTMHGFNKRGRSELCNKNSAILLHDPHHGEERRRHTTTITTHDQYHEEEMMPPWKRARVATPPPRNLIDDLDNSAIDRIMSFLDVKSLLQFVSCSKRTISSSPDEAILTHEHVVRSTLITGGIDAKKTVEEVISLALEKRSVFLPSPLRLLRLANGKRCERKQCCSSLINGSIRPGYGLFLCWNCLVDETKAVKISHPMIKDRRTAKIVYNKKAYVLARPYTDIGGERAGPILSRAECGRRGTGAIALLSTADEGWSEERKQRITECAQQATRDNAKRVLAKKRRTREAQQLLFEKAEVMNGLDTTDCCSYRLSLRSNDRPASLRQKRPSICFKCAFIDGSKIRPFISTLFTPKMSMVKLQETVADFNTKEGISGDMLGTSGTYLTTRGRRGESAINIFLRTRGEQLRDVSGFTLFPMLFIQPPADDAFSLRKVLEMNRSHDCC
jgi:hypothetical protein